MAPTRPGHPSRCRGSAFLRLPLEVRLLIYGFCIPQNLRMAMHACMYHKSRPPGWLEPPWRYDESQDRYDPDVVRRHLEEVESFYNGWTSGCLVDEKNEEPCGLDDYCVIPEETSPSLPSAFPALLLVCRQVTEEVTSVLYAANTFSVDVASGGEQILLGDFKPETREKMRRMIVVFKLLGDPRQPRFAIRPETWDPALGNLSVLGIVAQRTDPASALVGGRAEPDDGREEWPGWFAPIMEYMARTLSPTAKVVVDVNGDEDVAQMVEKAFPGRCVFQRMRLGDPIFQRLGYAPLYW